MNYTTVVGNIENNGLSVNLKNGLNETTFLFLLMSNDKLRIVRTSELSQIIFTFDYHNVSVDLVESLGINKSYGFTLIMEDSQSNIVTISNLSYYGLESILKHLLKLAETTNNKYFNNKEFKAFIVEKLQKINFAYTDKLAKKDNNND